MGILHQPVHPMGMLTSATYRSSRNITRKRMEHKRAMVKKDQHRMSKTPHHVKAHIQRKKRFNPKRLFLTLAGFTGVGLLVAGSFVFAAGSSPQIYLAPSGGTYTIGNDVAIAVRENGNGSAINAAQVGLTYNASQLQYTSIDSTGSAFGNDLSPST